ncbi:serine/arginine repetitive matrix protein 2-like [Palaemon carinicauda]|uniref:serine/arginine repetitive matrix protein 2-like n=1 Tax=Palaemon carinicauda TaxID=392227 RepID=UPI0035B63C78
MSCKTDSSFRDKDNVHGLLRQVSCLVSLVIRRYCLLRRGRVCSSADTCPECVGWSDIQWVPYGTKKRKSAKRSPRKASVTSPLPSPSERSDGASVSPSPTQSRGRGKSVVEKEQSGLPQESSEGAVAVAGPSRASEEPSSASGESALVLGGNVSSDDPLWGSNVVSVSSPPSWACASGSSVGGDNQNKLRSTGNDAFGWKLPKTPGRSPLRMEEGLDPWLPSIERHGSFPAPLTEVPEDFLQPSTSGTQRVTKSPAVPATARHMISAVSSGSSEDYYSSGKEARRKHRRRRERSRSRRSRSRSRSPLPRAEFSPRIPSSKHGLDPRNQVRRKDSTGRRKSSKPPVHPAQRGKTRFFSGSLAEPAQLVQPSGRKERFPLSGQPTGTASSSPRALERTRVLAESAMPALTPAPGADVPADEVQYLGRTAPLAPRTRRPVGVPGNPAPRSQAETSADERKGSPTEDSAYRRLTGYSAKETPYWLRCPVSFQTGKRGP